MGGKKQTEQRHRELGATLGKLLREARHTAKLSQEKLAEYADIDRTYPCLIESGKRQPTVDVYIRICHALRLDPSRFMTQLTDKLKQL